MVGWLCRDMFRNRIAFSHFKPSLSKTYCHFMRQSIERQVTHASRLSVFVIARNLQKSNLKEMMKQWRAWVKHFKIADWIEETMWTRWDENSRHSLGPQPHRSTKKDCITVQRECHMFRQNKNSLFMPRMQRNVCTTKKRDILARKIYMRHTIKFRECNKKGVVYQLAILCGRTNAGRSGRCLNV